MLITSKTRFGKLRPKYTQNVMPGSAKKIECICDCGKETLAVINQLISGKTKTCGRCNEVSVKVMKKKEIGKLRMKYPCDILPGSNKKEWWLCKCGRETLASPNSVFHGHIRSCGKCNLMTAEKIKGKPYGDLVIEIPQDIMPGSNKKVWWLCKCGNKIFARICQVISGGIVRCGKCNLITAEEMTGRWFGKLTMLKPADVCIGSMKIAEWLCKCGNVKLETINHVVSLHTTTCGNCFNAIQNWYTINKEKLKSLQFPINPGDFPEGGIKLPYTIQRSHDVFETECPICREMHNTSIHDIKMGKGLTCGCTKNRISNSCKEVKQFIESFGIEAQFEFKVNKLAYDIFIPLYNLLIEYNDKVAQLS